jgi:hypothetical protein
MGASIHGYFDFPAIYEHMVDRAASLDLPFVEVGVWCGKSLLFAAGYAEEHCPSWKKLVGVDTFRDMDLTELNEEIHVKGEYAPLFETLSHRDRLSLSARAHIIIGKSVETAPLFDNGSIGALFIDAAHDYDSVKADLLAWGKKVSPSGIIAGHDYYHPPVARAVDEYFPKGVTRDGACWIGVL